MAPTTRDGWAAHQRGGSPSPGTDRLRSTGPAAENVVIQAEFGVRDSARAADSGALDLAKATDGESRVTYRRRAGQMEG